MAIPASMFPCPKCRRNLPQSGTLEIDGVEVTTYQCDECIREIEMFGVKTEVALTFAVDERGRVFDPAEPDGELRF